MNRYCTCGNLKMDHVRQNAVDQRSALADTLNRLVRLPDLQDLTVCHIAQRDLDKGDIDSALARLRVDADKIRPTCRELYDIIHANIQNTKLPCPGFQPAPVTAKGTAIHRCKQIGFGKRMGRCLYFHIDYLWEIPETAFPKRIINRAVKAFMKSYPEWWCGGEPVCQCVRLDLDCWNVRFDEAEDFETSREPVVGNWFAVNLAGNVTRGHSNNIWHHKWLWIKPCSRDWEDVSYNWSLKYAPLMTGVPSGNWEAFKQQLKNVGLS